jgi:hypothetical protein
MTGISDDAEALRANGVTVALYLDELRRQCEAAGVGPSRVLKASAGLACMCAMHSLPPVTAHRAARLACQAAQASLTANVRKLERGPIELHDMHAIVECALTSGGLADVMIACALFLMYAGFLRLHDMLGVLVHEDLMVFVQDEARPGVTQYVDIFIPRSKTDQAWEGAWVAIPAMHPYTDAPWCPVSLLQHLLLIGGYCTSPPDPDTDVG